MVAHLSCPRYRVADMMRVPWSEGCDASFCLSSFGLEDGYAPSLYGSLKALSTCHCGYIDVLAVFEDFSWRDRLSKKRFRVFELLLDCASTDFDLGYVRLFSGQAGLFWLGDGDDSNFRRVCQVCFYLLYFFFWVKVLWKGENAFQIVWRIFHPSF